MGTRLLPTDIFTKACASATIVLFDQEINISIPSYGKKGFARGSLILEQDTSSISEVIAELEGRLKTTTTESGAITINTFKQTYSLWSPGSSSPCPGTIDFSCQFPATFQHQGVEYPLPPSYNAKLPGFPALFAKCTYKLTFTIAKDRRLGFLLKTKVIQIPVEYKPHASPPRGISPVPNFLSAIKIIPEEWYQSSFVLNAQTSSNLAPIQCQAFIPSVRIFGLADTIPIHIQLSGPLSSLREFMLPSSPASGDECGKPPVRVYLTRMLTVEHRGKSTWRAIRIGEGCFKPLPLVVNFDCDCQPACVFNDSCVQPVDWAGEVGCNPDVAVGGFQAAGLTVKDFITLELTPSKTSALPPRQHALVIRFVTETYIDDWTAPEILSE